MRELVNFWQDESFVSISMSTPISPVEIPDYEFDFSMSMSMPLPEDISIWWDLDLSYSYSMPVEEEATVVSTVDDSTTEEGNTGGDETAAENLGDEPVANVPRDSSNLAAGLVVGLVVAAIAVLSIFYVRKHHRASSAASVMTPLSNNASIS
jgi:hypothetical protein